MRTSIIPTTLFAFSVDNTKFIETSKALSKHLKHISNLDVDCFVDNDQIYILELNCRFGGQYPFSHNAGADFPKQIIEWLNNKPTNSRLITPNIGVTSCKELNPVVMYHGK